MLALIRLPVFVNEGYCLSLDAVELVIIAYISCTLLVLAATHTNYKTYADADRSFTSQRGEEAMNRFALSQVLLLSTSAKPALTKSTAFCIHPSVRASKKKLKRLKTNSSFHFLNHR